MRTISLAVSLLLGLTATAAAQRAPDMATLDRGDGISKFGIDVGLTFLEHPPYDAALRIEPYGQFVGDNGLGFYVAFPISTSFGGDDNLAPLPRNATAVGNFDLGMLYVLESSPDVSFVFRGGVGLPTASDGGDESLTRYFASFPRLTDSALAASDAVYVRLAVSPLVHIRRWFLRADLGVDIGVDDGADELLRLNVGGGIDLDAVAVGLELVNLARFGTFDGDERWRHTLAVTVRFMGEQLQPFVSVGAPLDDGVRTLVSAFVSAGIQVAL